MELHPQSLCLLICQMKCFCLISMDLAASQLLFGFWLLGF